VHFRGELRAPIRGPALVEEEYTTVFVADGWTCGPGEGGDLIARREGASQ
jgi:N-methylhydantoinase A